MVVGSSSSRSMSVLRAPRRSGSSQALSKVPPQPEDSCTFHVPLAVVVAAATQRNAPHARLGAVGTRVGRHHSCGRRGCGRLVVPAFRSWLPWKEVHAEHLLKRTDRRDVHPGRSREDVVDRASRQTSFRSDRRLGSASELSFETPRDLRRPGDCGRTTRPFGAIWPRTGAEVRLRPAAANPSSTVGHNAQGSSLSATVPGPLPTATGPAGGCVAIDVGFTLH